VSPHERINPNDHPRSSATLDAALRREGVDVRTGVRAAHVRPVAGRDGAHVVELSDASSVEGNEILLAIKTRTPLDVLADTIHPFPTTVRVMGGLFAQAARAVAS